MSRRWWIVEHSSRGVLVDIDYDGKPRFNWVDPRGSEKHWLFETEGKARNMLDRIPEPTRARCKVRGFYEERKGNE
jgi:hypothetical protein